jgi:acyl-CoA reductase-like NAD-dependent aldehyde dehydrogenase
VPAERVGRSRELAASILLGGGQFCTKPGIVLVVGDEIARFVDALARCLSPRASRAQSRARQFRQTRRQLCNIARRSRRHTENPLIPPR